MRLRQVVPAALLVLAACSGGGGGDDEGGGEAVGSSEAVEALAEEGLFVIDVRSPEDYADGYLKGAVNLPVEDPSFAARAESLGEDGQYFVYGEDGAQAEEAATVLRDLGLEVDAAELGYEELLEEGAEEG